MNATFDPHAEHAGHRTHESNQSLWLLVIAPTIWATHFLASYVTAAVYCAKFAPADGSLATVRWAIAGYTIAALIGIAVTAWFGWRRQRYGTPEDVHIDTPLVRHRFLGTATLLLSMLSTVATLYTAMTVIFLGDCS